MKKRRAIFEQNRRVELFEKLHVLRLFSSWFSRGFLQNKLLGIIVKN